MTHKSYEGRILIGNFLLAEYVIRIWILEHKGNIKSISLDIPFNSIDHRKSNFNVISFKKYSRNIHKRTWPSSTIQNGLRIVHKWFWNGYERVFGGFCGKKTKTVEILSKKSRRLSHKLYIYHEFGGIWLT